MTIATYKEASRNTLREIMQQDENVFLYGCDVGDFTCTFGATEGLKESFGEKRVFSTPVSEEGNLGIGIGAAINGLRPINIHIRADFLLLAMNQLVNIASNTKYITDGKLNIPLTIRAIVGRGWGQGAQHSKSMHSIFAHIPGLKVYLPVTSQDISHILKKSVKENCPSIILEHRWLFDIKSEYLESKIFEPIEVVSTGGDITIIATSWMVVEAIFAKNILEKNGVSAEIIAVKEVTSQDLEKLYKSVLKTKNCIIADYDWVHCGYGSELAKNIYDNCYKKLNAPINTIGFDFTPCPTARALENEFYPNAQAIISSAMKILKKKDVNHDEIKYLSYENKFKGPF